MRTKTVKIVDSFVPAGEGGGIPDQSLRNISCGHHIGSVFASKMPVVPFKQKKIETDGAETSLVALMAFYFCPGMKKKGKNATSSFSIPRVRKHH